MEVVGEVRVGEPFKLQTVGELQTEGVANICAGVGPLSNWPARQRNAKLIDKDISWSAVVLHKRRQVIPQSLLGKLIA